MARTANVRITFGKRRVCFSFRTPSIEREKILRPGRPIKFVRRVTPVYSRRLYKYRSVYTRTSINMFTTVPFFYVSNTKTAAIKKFTLPYNNDRKIILIEIPRAIIIIIIIIRTCVFVYVIAENRTIITLFVQKRIWFQPRRIGYDGVLHNYVFVTNKLTYLFVHEILITIFYRVRKRDFLLNRRAATISITLRCLSGFAFIRFSCRASYRDGVADDASNSVCSPIDFP